MSEENSVQGKSMSGDGSSSAGRLPKGEKSLFVIPEHPKTVFDDKKFLDLLEGSISLTIEEKKRVVSAIPRLDQSQIDELFTIFEEEQKKFSELEKEFSEDVDKLKRERAKEREILEIKEEEAEEESGVLDEAEALKRKLRGE